jgi:hypothetical protein
VHRHSSSNSTTCSMSKTTSSIKMARSSSDMAQTTSHPLQMLMPPREREPTRPCLATLTTPTTNRKERNQENGHKSNHDISTTLHLPLPPLSPPLPHKTCFANPITLPTASNPLLSGLGLPRSLLTGQAAHLTAWPRLSIPTPTLFSSGMKA